MAEVYTRTAERKRLAGAAMHLLGTDVGQEYLTIDQQTPPVREKEQKLRLFNACFETVQ
jgi:hypothetical protein